MISETAKRSVVTLASIKRFNDLLVLKETIPAVHPKAKIIPACFRSAMCQTSKLE